MTEPAFKRQSQETAQRILKGARALLTERGVLEVSLAEICERAGTNIALVSYYFGNREGLMLALALADGATALTHMSRLLASDLSASEKISAHIRGLIETYYRYPYLNRLLQKLLREGSPEASQQLGEALVKPVAEARRSIIAEGITAGDFRNVDVGMTSFAIDGACAHMFSSMQGRRAVLGDGTLNKSLVDRYAKSVSDLICRGLAINQRSAG